MFTHCLPSALLLLTIFSRASSENLYQTKVLKGEVFHLEYKDYKYSLPPGQCYGILYTDGFCDFGVASIQIDFKDPVRYPTVTITDSLDKAIMNRQPPCLNELVVNAKIGCRGLLQHKDLDTTTTLPQLKLN